ncbi:mitochondrial 2-oxoglutarate/malate carrier protein [Amyelois transitella]|uniref:mitochondrial 2-oxoglutarate/malate carrier protein n=1 Tax=Amyelois transitella TaxID=680683 RepID=UPI00067D88E1|nr:mitochondrial 2-oxoglutarate/malate carrier protein [Amyelois transitella]
MSSENKPKNIPAYANFLIGGGAGVLARCVVHPADLIKTRMQLGPKNQSFTNTVRQIVARDGVVGLYAGISAALFRQGTYTTARFGFFNIMFDYYKGAYGMPGFGAKLVLGLISGGLSAIIGNPGEVVLVRMTADGHLPPGKRRDYKNVFNALSRMIKEEGLATLWRGTSSTVVRAMIVNAAQLGTYAQAREMLLPTLGEGLLLQFCASMISGVVTSVASLPIDIVKTRVQNATEGASQFKVFFDIIKYEGPLALWNGFLPCLIKVAPHTILTFMFFEQLVVLYRMIEGGPIK